MWNLSQLTSGNEGAIASTRSSQYGIEIAIPLDLVADVRCPPRASPSAPAGQFERVAQDPIDADPGHHRLLEHDLTLGAGEHPAADRRVLALGVLADDDEVDVPGAAAGQRRARRRASAAPAAARRIGRRCGEIPGSIPTARCGRGPCRASPPRRTGSRRNRRRAGASRRASSPRARRSSRTRRNPADGRSISKPNAAGRRAQHPQPLGQHFTADSVPGIAAIVYRR